MTKLAFPDAPQLRLLEPADATELHALIEANRAHLARWLPWAAGQRPEGTEDFIRRGRAQFDAHNGFQAAIAPEGRIEGVVGFHAIDWGNRSTSLGYWLGEASQGSGTMTEAVRALTEHAFRKWGLNRIEIQAAPGNLRSRAIPERLGYLEEGLLREAELVGGRYLDGVVYGMVASDWGPL
jgi:ribosomal-protein-serine acetyltransferase